MAFLLLSYFSFFSTFSGGTVGVFSAFVSIFLRARFDHNFYRFFFLHLIVHFEDWFRLEKSRRESEREIKSAIEIKGVRFQNKSKWIFMLSSSIFIGTLLKWFFCMLAKFKLLIDFHGSSFLLSFFLFCI